MCNYKFNFFSFLCIFTQYASGYSTSACSIIHRKREYLYLLLVSLFKACGFALSVETSNAEAHANIWYYHSMIMLVNHRAVCIHPIGIYRCFVFDGLFWNCHISEQSRTKRKVNAFFYVLTHPNKLKFNRLKWASANIVNIWLMCVLCELIYENIFISFHIAFCMGVFNRTSVYRFKKIQS